MRKTIRVTIIVLVLLVSGLLQGQEQRIKPKTSTFKFKLGILYINSPTGKRFRQGVIEAVKGYSREDIFETIDFPYDNETDGVKTLVSLMTPGNSDKDKSRKVDVILGPTESGVFVRAIERRKELSAAGIPVISSQVAAKIPHQVGGWFFRTNINVERRSHVIYDFLNKYWVRSIAVLYEENEFARRAEQAFGKELREQQKNLYLPLSYSSTDEARSQIRRILDQRPEAVGIFGNRADIARLFKLLKNLNAGSTRYAPLTFSIIDTRVIQDSIEPDYSVYFVSATDITKDKDFDDVEALSYDTAAIILGELEALTKNGTFNYEDRSWQQTFRNRFEAILAGSIGIRQDQGKIKRKTGLSFKNYENKTTPRVFQLSRETIVPVKLGETITFPGKIWNKVTLIWDRFGFWPVVNLFIILIVIVFMSVKDINRWWWGKSRDLFKGIHFWLLLVANIAIAYTIYFYLGETGNLRYDSILMALILSLTPSTILHLTLFETSTGKAIGLARYYDNFLQWVYDSTAIKNYMENKFYINVIAYHNSLDGMRTILKDIYRNKPDEQNKEQRRRMQTMMEDAVREADSWLGRRKALARIVLQKLTWKGCVEHNLVPADLKGDDPESEEVRKKLKKKDKDYEEELKNKDPEEIVLEAARRCGKKPLMKILIDEKINAALKELKPARRQELETDYEKDLNEMKTSTAIMRKKITFLFLLKGYDKDFSKNIKGSKGSESEKMLNEVLDCCEDDKLKDKVQKRVKRRVEKLINKMWMDKEKSKEEKERYLRVFEDKFKCREENGELKCLLNEDEEIDETCFKEGLKFLFAFHDWDEGNGLLPAGNAQKAPARAKQEPDG
jgi:hypothetical protein